jgi:hypothetical protein
MTSEPEPDWETILEMQIEAERDFFGWDENSDAGESAWSEVEPPY